MYFKNENGMMHVLKTSQFEFEKSVAQKERKNPSNYSAKYVTLFSQLNIQQKDRIPNICDIPNSDQYKK